MKIPATACTAVLLTFLFVTLQAHAQLPGLPGEAAGDRAVSLAAGDQGSAYVAPGGDHALLVWADERSNPYAYYEYETSADIYGLRLKPDGSAVEPVPFAIVAERAGQGSPKAAWNGSHWLVVFSSNGLSGTGYYYSSGLAAIRVAPDGTLVDPQPIPLYGLNSGSVSNWDVASDGNQWVVVTQGNDLSSDIVAVRVSADGVMLDPPTRTLVPETYYGRTGLKLAFADGTYLLTYNDRDGTRAVRFDGDLNPLGANPALLLPHSLSGLAANGAGFYVAWGAQKPDFSQAVFGSRVSAAGELLDAPGLELSGAFPPQTNLGSIGVAWDGLDWRISWPSGSGVRVATVNTAGQLAAAGGAGADGIVAGVTGGTGGGGLHIAWSEFFDNEYDVHRATVDAAGSVVANEGASTGTPRQHRGDLAAGADGYLLAYRSVASGSVRVLAQALDADGVPLTAEPLELDAGTLLSGPGSPAVAWNGAVYLVSWGAPGGVYAQRLGADGGAIDAAPFLVMSPGFGAVDVAALGNDFLVAGFRFGSSVQYIRPIGARVAGDGRVLDTPPLELGDYYTVYSRDLALAALDDRWLAAWHTNVTHDDPLASTRARFIDPDGSLSDGFQAHGYFSTSGGNSVFTLALASDGQRSLLVQSQELTSGVETDLLAHVIESDGSVGPQINLTPWAGNQYRPQLSFDGRDYILVYQDQKNRLAPHTLDQLDARSDIYGMRIAPDGAVIDPQGFLVADAAVAETDPNLASRGAETLLLASQMQNDGVHSAYRLRLGDILDGTNRFPVAMAAAAPREGDVPLTVDFSAAGSHDPEDGAVAGYLWQFGDGETSSQAAVAHEYALPGEYLALLTVFDAQGQSATQGVTVVATPVNTPPVAVASANRYEGPVPLSVELYARGSFDPDGQLGNTEWYENGLRLSYNPTAYRTFTTAGPHLVTLRVFDSRGAVSEDTVTITALPASENQAPTAVAGATPSSGEAPLAVAFDGTGSSDPDGSIATYLWDFGDGSSGSGARPTHLYTATGSYLATLTVTDNGGLSDSAVVDITVSGLSGEALLTAIDLSTSSKRGQRNAQAVVTVTNGDGGAERSAIVQGRWTFPDGTSQTRYEYSDRKGQASFVVGADLDGLYVFEILTVTKSGFAWSAGSSETTESITIGAPGVNQPPAASFTDNCSGLTCAFDGGASSDADGTVVDYAWVFGDGGSDSGVSTTHSYASAGEFTVTLTVTDDQGATNSTARTISVSGGEPPAETAVHVADLDGFGTVLPRNRWQADVVISVVTDVGAAVSGATVTGSWGGGANGSASCVTDAGGHCAVIKGNLKSNLDSVSFSVSAISGASLVYDPDANTDPDGDSDGTSIVILRP